MCGLVLPTDARRRCHHQYGQGAAREKSTFCTIHDGSFAVRDKSDNGKRNGDSTPNGSCCLDSFNDLGGSSASACEERFGSLDLVIVRKQGQQKFACCDFRLIANGLVLG